MVHCFIQQHVCRSCKLRKKYNTGTIDHGRGFQMIARAIEEESQKLLGLKARIGRLAGIYADLGMRTDRYAGPSVHDMEMYGFLDPLENRPAWRRDGILGNYLFLEGSWVPDRDEWEELEDVSVMDVAGEVDGDEWEDMC